MRRIAIYIDGSPNDADSLTSAALFSRRVGARLEVFHPRKRSKVVVTDVVGTASILDDDSVAVSAADAARSAFERVCGDLDFASWHVINDSPADAVAKLGLLYDLTILERVTEETGPQVLALNTALFETGGPVLVTPPRAPSTLGETVAVAWSGNIQSARAVRSALPLLVAADQVCILTNTANARAEAPELAAYLKVHGIASRAYTFEGERLSARARGRAMLAAIESMGADCLVMGAYGEHRMEAIFGLGRATQKVVTASPVPILLQS
jgi:nucleotide-binding universal stress UspA family protein